MISCTQSSLLQRRLLLIAMLLMDSFVLVNYQALFLLVPLKLHQLLVLLLVWLKLLVLPVTAMTVSAGLLNILVSDLASPFQLDICSIVYITVLYSLLFCLKIL